MGIKAGHGIRVIESNSISLSIVQTHLFGDEGRSQLDIGALVNGSALTVETLVLTLKDNDTNLIIAQAEFNPGDDISSVTPISETNWTGATNPATFFDAGSLIQDGASFQWRRKDWAEITGNYGSTRKKDSKNLRWELSLNIGGFSSAIAAKAFYESNNQYDMIEVLDADHLVIGNQFDSEAYILDINDSTTTRLALAGGPNFQGLVGIHVDSSGNHISLGIRYTGQTTIRTYTFVSDDNWTFVDNTGGGSNSRFSNNMSGTIYPSQQINGMDVLFIHKFAAAGFAYTTVPVAWDGTAYNTHAFLSDFTGTNRSDYSRAMWNDDGTKFWLLFRNSATNVNLIREYDIVGPLLSVGSYSIVRNIIPINSDINWNSASDTCDLIGTDGVIGDFSGSDPMILFYGGNAVDSGGFNPQDVKIMQYNGVDFEISLFDATALTGLDDGISGNAGLVYDRTLNRLGLTMFTPDIGSPTPRVQMYDVSTPGVSPVTVSDYDAANLTDVRSINY